MGGQRWGGRGEGAGVWGGSRGEGGEGVSRGAEAESRQQGGMKSESEKRGQQEAPEQQLWAAPTKILIIPYMCPTPACNPPPILGYICPTLAHNSSSTRSTSSTPHTCPYAPHLSIHDDPEREEQARDRSAPP